MAAPQDVNFCPRCGHPLSDAIRFGKPHRVCEACGFIYFHDPKVAAVVFITQGDRVLLIKRAVDPQRGKWALPAGYIDYGEDPREAAVREVREETGLEIRITRLIDVLGPGAAEDGTASIVILFEGEVTGGTLSAHDDAEQAAFFAPEELPTGQIAFESTRRLLGHWLSARSGG
ncbi:MAG TPA: NUDIX domain-containing protein [Chloroflexi bacterium]|nr:NUDIX domain-containing protein [Chloroflexota bacterium]